MKKFLKSRYVWCIVLGYVVAVVIGHLAASRFEAGDARERQAVLLRQGAISVTARMNPLSKLDIFGEIESGTVSVEVSVNERGHITRIVTFGDKVRGDEGQSALSYDLDADGVQDIRLISFGSVRENKIRQICVDKDWVDAEEIDPVKMTAKVDGQLFVFDKRAGTWRASRDELEQSGRPDTLPGGSITDRADGTGMPSP